MAIPNDPITREEQYLASMAGQEVDLPQPITRVEKYLAKASGMDVETPDPITREEKYLDAIAEGGGGSSVTVEPLTITQNGTTTAPSGTAYSPVTTKVPNSYGAADEGKVVSNGALVAQTAHVDVTANATIDTTTNNSVKVVVPSFVYQYVDYESFEDMGYVFDYLSIDAQTWQIKLKQQRGGAYELVCLPFSGSLPTTLNFISPIPVSLSGFAVTGYLSVVFERLNDHYELMYIQFVSADGYHNVKSQLENEYQIITVTKYEATVEFYPE